MNKIFALATVTLLSMGSVNAADLIIDEPVAQVAFTDVGFDWSGFYAGLNGGYASGQAISQGAVTGVNTSPAIAGGLVGGTLGFNAQFDNFVLGVEGDVAWSGVKGSTACTANVAYNCEGNLDWLGTIKARAGVAVDRILFFGTAGFAAGGTTTKITPAAPALTNTFSGVMTGWTVGGGVEAAVTEAISIKAEYSYVRLGGLQAPAGTLSSTEASNLSAINHVVKVGVNFHF